jgi:hypothetical protein
LQLGLRPVTSRLRKFLLAALHAAARFFNFLLIVQKKVTKKRTRELMRFLLRKTVLDLVASCFPFAAQIAISLGPILSLAIQVFCSCKSGKTGWNF